MGVVDTFGSTLFGQPCQCYIPYRLSTNNTNVITGTSASPRCFFFMGLSWILVNVKWISQVRSCLQTMTIRFVTQQEELQEEYSLTLTKPLKKPKNFDPGKVTLSFKWWKREIEVVEIEDTNMSSRKKTTVVRKIFFLFLSAPSCVLLICYYESLRFTGKCSDSI